MGWSFRKCSGVDAEIPPPARAEVEVQRRYHGGTDRKEAMSTLARRECDTFADLFDWLEAGFPAFPVLRPFSGAQLMRVEEFGDAGYYVLRAEMPGFDPDKDVEIAVQDGLLTVRAERREQRKEGGRSEFHYGTVHPHLAAAAGAVEDDVKATYHDGILEIRVPVAEQKKPEAKRITVVKG